MPGPWALAGVGSKSLPFGKPSLSPLLTVT